MLSDFKKENKITESRMPFIAVGGCFLLLYCDESAGSPKTLVYASHTVPVIIISSVLENCMYSPLEMSKIYVES